MKNQYGVYQEAVKLTKDILIQTMIRGAFGNQAIYQSDRQFKKIYIL